MEIYKFQQISVLAVCTIAGMLCAMVYDIFKVYRRCSPPSVFRTSVCDILFWAVSALIVYLAIHMSNNAKLRWYEPIGVISGYILYTLYMSKYCTCVIGKLMRISNRLRRAILHFRRISRKFLHILILPTKRCTEYLKTRLLYVVSTSLDKSKNRFNKTHIKKPEN